MTPTELIGAINRALCRLPQDSQATLKRTYEKTYMMVALYNDLLMTPTKGGKNRLEDFLHAIQQEYQRLEIPYLGPATKAR